jgi:undecaprenyl-diphosphatase
MNWDEQLFLAINGLAGRSPGVDWAMAELARPGLLWLPGILLGIYWLWLSWREALVAAPVLAVAIGLVDAVGAQLKHLAQRPRPCDTLPGIRELVGCGGTFGFPSNHAVNTAAAAAFLQLLYPRSGWISWPAVFVVGFARVYVGAHYVTDVVGGWLIGGLFGAGAAWALLRWPRFPRPAAKPAPSACHQPPG